CHGDGQMQCHICHGRRHETCHTCQGLKHISCQTCHQTGHMTEQFHVNYHAEAVGTLSPPNDIHHNVQQFIQDVGFQKMIADQHTRTQLSAPVMENDRLIFPLSVDLPLITAEFSVEGKPVQAYIAGYNSHILSI